MVRVTRTLRRYSPCPSYITEPYRNDKWMEELRENPYFAEDTRESHEVYKAVPPKASYIVQSYENWNRVLGERAWAKNFRLHVILEPEEYNVMVAVKLAVPKDECRKGRDAMQGMVAFHKILGPLFGLPGTKELQEVVHELEGKVYFTYVGRFDEAKVYAVMERLRMINAPDDVIPPAKKRRH